MSVIPVGGTRLHRRVYYTVRFAFSSSASRTYKMRIDRVNQALSAHLETVSYDSDSDELETCRPVVVFESINRQAFRRWLDRHEGDLRRWEYEPLTTTPPTGRVAIYSFPTQVHTYTAGGLIYKIAYQADALAHACGGSELAIGNDPRHDVGDRDQEPDGCLKPTFAPANTTPTLIVEIAYKNESWPKLVAKLERWMRPTTAVQVAIGVKIFKTKQRVIMLQRYGDRTVQDFAVGQPGTISFRLGMLYRGYRMPRALAGHENDMIRIDLGELAREIHLWTAEP